MKYHRIPNERKMVFFVVRTSRYFVSCRIPRYHAVYCCIPPYLPYPATSCKFLPYPATSRHILPLAAVSFRILPYPAVSCRIRCAYQGNPNVPSPCSILYEDWEPHYAEDPDLTVLLDLGIKKN